MERKEWNALLDGYLLNGTMSSTGYADLNQIQQAVIQELKRSIERIKRNNKLNNE